MAKPRVFVSSTYYDLKHVRNALSTFIDGIGYESVLFENGDIPFHHDVPLDESCYAEVKSCHIVVLIIGGRYGSPASDVGEDIKKAQLEKRYEFYNSITKKEYVAARDLDIPVFTFVESGVLAEYQTFKKNRENINIEYAHVDSPNVFLLLDEILSQRKNNVVKDFERIEEIVFWLRDQWAGLFADLLTKKKDVTVLKDISSNVLDLKSIAETLKQYTEAIGKKVDVEHFDEMIEVVNKKELTDKILRFSNEQLIRYLVEKYSCDPIDMFEKISKHRDFKSFMNSIQHKATAAELIVLVNSEGAVADYKAIRVNYFPESLSVTEAMENAASQMSRLKKTVDELTSKKSS